MGHATRSVRRAVAAAAAAAVWVVGTVIGPPVSQAAIRCVQDDVRPVVGDVDGDHRAEVVVGVPNFTGADGENDVGAVDVHLGNGGRQSVTPDAVGAGRAAGARFGAAVGLGPYVDPDHCSDLLVGAPGLDDGQGPCSCCTARAWGSPRMTQ